MVKKMKVLPSSEKTVSGGQPQEKRNFNSNPKNHSASRFGGQGGCALHTKQVATYQRPLTASPAWPGTLLDRNCNCARRKTRPNAADKAPETT